MVKPFLTIAFVVLFVVPPGGWAAVARAEDSVARLYQTSYEHEVKQEFGAALQVLERFPAPRGAPTCSNSDMAGCSI